MNNLQQLFSELMAEGYSAEEALAMINTGSTAVNIAPAVATTAASAAPAAGGLLGTAGTGLGTIAGKARGLLGKGTGSLKGMYSNLNNAYMASNGTGNALWSKARGIDGLGKLANWGMGISQGVQGISNINNISNADADFDDMKSKVQLSAMNNPMYASYLTADQKSQLRKVQNGTFGSGSSVDEGLSAGARSIPQALLSALGGFVVGGVPGAIIQSAGTLVNSGLKGAAEGKNKKTAELQALYETLSQAENDYNAMRRPANLTSAGLQRRYANVLM